MFIPFTVPSDAGALLLVYAKYDVLEPFKTLPALIDEH
jgi:hypothetical protein